MREGKGKKKIPSIFEAISQKGDSIYLVLPLSEKEGKKKRVSHSQSMVCNLNILYWLHTYIQSHIPDTDHKYVCPACLPAAGPLAVYP